MITGPVDTFDAIESGISRAGWPMRRSRRGGFGVSTAICHGGDSPYKLEIMPREDGGFAAKCWTAGCDGRDLYDAIRRVAQVGEGYDAPAVGSPTRSTASAAPTSSRGLSYAERLWRDSITIPLDPEHPARRWIAARNLYWTGIPAPAVLRWLDAVGRWPQHEGAGALVCLYAAPEGWTSAWPRLPGPQAVELLHVDAAGAKALDRPEADGGTSKRSHGQRDGTLCIMGDPRPGKASHLSLTEGVADAVGRSARDMATAAAFGGVSVKGAASELATWLATWRSTTLWADKDAAGIRAGWELRDACAEAGIALDVRLLRDCKDVAEAASLHRLPTLEMDLVRELTRDLQQKDKLPQWEAVRLAAFTVGGEVD